MDSLTQVELIFSAAVDIDSPAELEAYLREHCPTLEIRRQVEQLLAANVNADSFFTDLPSPLTAVAHDAPWDDQK